MALGSTGKLGAIGVKGHQVTSGTLESLGACAQLAITAKIEEIAVLGRLVLTNKLTKSTSLLLDVRMVAEGFGVNRQKASKFSNFPTLIYPFSDPLIYLLYIITIK